MTVLAAGIQKLVQAGLFFIAERRLVAAQELVPARNRDQIALEGANGLGQVVEGHRMLLAREGLLKRLHVLGHGVDHGQHPLLVRHRHFHRIEDRPLGLLLDIGRAAVPELHEMPRRVVDRGRVACTFLPLVAVGHRLVVDAVVA